MLFRYVRAMAAGTLVTLALLYLMQALITANAGTKPGSRERSVLRLAVVKEDSETIIETPSTPPPPPLPPPDILIDREFDPGGDMPALTVPTPRHGSVPTGLGDLFAPVGDGPLVAIVRVEPDYPVRAEQEGLEGWVIVEYDVTPAGTVENVRIVDSSHRVFERTAIRAAERFRYRPRIVGGVPQATRGLRNRFRFEMGRG